MRILLSIIMITSGLSALAQDLGPQVLTFKSWKEQQVLSAQNQMLRISARIAQLKSSKTSKTDKKEVEVSSRNVRKSELDPMTEAEKELRRAQDSLKAATEWTVEDYVNVYIPTLRNQPEALQKLTEQLSKEELAEILKLMLSKPGIDAKQGAPMIGGLTKPSNVQFR